MKHKNTLVNLTKNAFKASLILFVIASGLMIYTVIDADPTVNFHSVDAGQTIYSLPIYRHAGEKFQVYVGINSYESSNGENNYPANALQIVIYKSLNSDFKDAQIIGEFTTGGVYREIESIDNAYYRMSVTNLLNVNVGVITGDAHANYGLIIAFAIAMIMFGISVSLFSLAFSLTLTGLILFGLGYPIYYMIKQENENRQMRNKGVYYPRGYTSQTEVSQANPSNNQQQG